MSIAAWQPEQANNLRLAEEILQSSVAKFPKFDRAYFELAWVYSLQGSYEKALSAINMAIEFASTPNHWYFARKGQIYRGIGNFDLGERGIPRSVEDRSTKCSH